MVWRRGWAVDPNRTGEVVAEVDPSSVAVTTIHSTQEASYHPAPYSQQTETPSTNDVHTDSGPQIQVSNSSSMRVFPPVYEAREDRKARKRRRDRDRAREAESLPNLWDEERRRKRRLRGMESRG